MKYTFYGIEMLFGLLLYSIKKIVPVGHSHDYFVKIIIVVDV